MHPEPNFHPQREGEGAREREGGGGEVEMNLNSVLNERLSLSYDSMA